MRPQELQNIAEFLGIKVNSKTDAKLFKAVFVAEGLFHSFNIAT
jgi:hypothetical protein